MRSIHVFVVALCLLLSIGVMTVSAQREPDFYSVNYRVLNVWESPYGYRLILRGANFVDREFYVPSRWVYVDKTAIVNFTSSEAAPYLQGYFDRESGELSFFRLVLPRNPNHPSFAYDIKEGLEERFTAASLNSL